MDNDNELGNPMITSDDDLQLCLMDQPQLSRSNSKRSRRVDDPDGSPNSSTYRVTEQLQERLAATMNTCLLGFSTAMSQQYVQAQELERAKFSSQWGDISGAVQRLVGAIETKFGERDSFRANVVDSLSQINIHNDLRHQDLQKPCLGYVISFLINPLWGHHPYRSCLRSDI